MTTPWNTVEAKTMVMPMLLVAISRQINPDNPLLVVRETAAKDPILSQVMRFVKKGWSNAFSEELKDFKKLEKRMVAFFYGVPVIIPSSLRTITPWTFRHATDETTCQINFGHREFMSKMHFLWPISK